jgi:hypothetical protein
VRMHMLMDVVGGQASEEQGADARAERTVIPAVRMRGADPEVMAAAGCEGKEGDQRLGICLVAGEACRPEGIGGTVAADWTESNTGATN